MQANEPIGEDGWFKNKKVACRVEKGAFDRSVKVAVEWSRAKISGRVPLALVV